MRDRTSSAQWQCALVVALGLWAWPPSIQAQSSRCASDLDQLRAVVDEAHDAVQRVSATEREARIAEEQHVRCTQLTSDEPFDAGCRQQRSASTAAQVTAAAASERSADALEAVASAVHAVELSCEFPMAGMIAVPPADGPPEDGGACESFLRRRPGVPLNTLRVLCDAEMTPEACAACLDGR